MACNVCGEETGWTENPLVYCDGNDGHCSVAVHQACYGITSVPSGAWLCGKCISLERKAKVRCELCPSKDGAFKRTSNGNFAHVVCSLYIPEVQFGNVTTMEPIILSSIPSDRFHKNCYICEDRGKEAKAKIGACMQCNKSGCKHYFHVTCAQAEGLLCEEAGNNDDNVKYCGYCKHHFQKLRKDPHIKFIPAFKPEKQRPEKGNSSPKIKKSHHNSDSTSKPPKKKQKFYGGINNLDDSDAESNRHEKHEKHDKHEKEKVKKKRTSSSSKDLSTNSNLNKHSSSKETSSSLFGKDESDNESISSGDSNIISPAKKLRETTFDSETDDELNFKRNKSDSDKKKAKKSSKNKDNNEKVIEKANKEVKKVKKRKEESNKMATKTSSLEEISNSVNKVSKSNLDDKRNEPDKSSKSSSHKEISGEKINHSKKLSAFEKKSEDDIEEEDEEEQEKQKSESELRKELPKQDFNLPELIKYKSSILTEESLKSQKPIESFEELLERQWNQTAQFLMEQSQFFDISSLISCLFQLKSENRSLEEKLKSLKQKRDHLIAVNSRLSIPLNGLENWETNNGSPLALTATSNSITTNNSTATPNNSSSHYTDATATSNLFYQNQNALANFSSIHSASTSTPSPTTSSSQQQKQSQSNSYFNLNNLNVNSINSSLNNQSFNLSNSNKTLDLNSNLSNSLFDAAAAANLKQQHHFNNSGLFQAAVNGQFNLNSNLNSASNTSSPSKLNATFNNGLTNSANNNLITSQLFQNFIQNQPHAYSLNQQTVQNTVLNGSQSKR